MQHTKRTGHAISKFRPMVQKLNP